MPHTPDPLDTIIPLLNAGAFSTAIPKLEALSRESPPRAAVFYNLGLALQVTQQLPEAVIALRRAVDLEPHFHHAWVALGNTYTKRGQFLEARQALERALELKPDDGQTQQNLAAALSALGEHKKAAGYARYAFDNQDPNPTTLFALGEVLALYALDASAGDEASDLRNEAVRALEAFLELYPNHPSTELVQSRISNLAEANFRARVDGEFRLDVFHYMAFALQTFERIGEAARNELVGTLLKITADGVDINNHSIRYPLKGLDRDYSGLALVSFLYVAMQQLKPELDLGIDLSREYAAALREHQSSAGQKAT